MKKVFLKIAFALVFLIVFNVLFFLLCGTDNKTSVWISYGFIHVAYLTILVIPLIRSKGKDSFYLNATLFNQAITYFLLELVIGVACIVWSPDSILWPLLVQSILWLVYAVILIGNTWANEVTTQSLEKRSQEIAPFREMTSELKKVSMMMKDQQVSKETMDVYDALYYSGSRQTAETIGLDIDISNLIGALKMRVRQGDETSPEVKQYLAELKGLIAERKATLKYFH